MFLHWQQIGTECATFGLPSPVNSAHGAHDRVPAAASEKLVKVLFQVVRFSGWVARLEVITFYRLFEFC